MNSVPLVAECPFDARTSHDSALSCVRVPVAIPWSATVAYILEASQVCDADGTGQRTYALHRHFVRVLHSQPNDLKTSSSTPDMRGWKSSLALC